MISRFSFMMVIMAVFPVAASTIPSNLIIEANPSLEGTVVIYEQPQYQKSFDIIVTTKSTKPINLTSANGCYKAFDGKGHEYNARSIELRLLGEITDRMPKQGRITFSSTDENIYDARFVKWDPECVDVTLRNK